MKSKPLDAAAAPRGEVGAAAGRRASAEAAEPAPRRAVGRRGRDRRRRQRVERGEEVVVRELDDGAGLHGQHPREVLRCARVLDLVPQDRLLLRDGKGHAVAGDDGDLLRGRRLEAAAAGLRGPLGDQDGGGGERDERCGGGDGSHDGSSSQG
jgi:hypothetical protein